MTELRNEKIYIQYAQSILDGTQTAGKLIKLACERFISWFDRDDIYFDYDDVDKKINFIGKFKLTEAPFTGQLFQLLKYQQWILASIFGWKYVGTNTRVTENVLLLVARKQGKTSLAAAIMLAAIMCDDNNGISGYTIANSASQAALAFKHISDLCRSVDPHKRLFKRLRHSISIPYVNSEIKILSADTTKLDGLNPQIFIQDEACETKTTAQWSIMKTGQGARKNPLAICISSAGYLVGEEYFLYAMWKMGKSILEKQIEDDTYFVALYQLDDEDDWKDEKCWCKACPSLGVTVSIDSLRKSILGAVNNPNTEVDVKTKQLNMWCQSNDTWIPYEKIQKITKHFDLSQFNKDEDYCLVGIDLAERDDLCVITTLVDKDNTLYFKAFPFCNRQALVKSKNKDMYRQWIKKGYLTLVDEDFIDFEWVVKKLQDIDEICPIGLVAYDPWNAKQLMLKCQQAGIPTKSVGQSAGVFSEPTSELEQRIYAGQNIVFDDNPVISWCFSNVLIKRDQNENKKPVKSDKSNKIDIVIGFIQTMKMYMELNGYDDANTEVAVLS